MKKVRRLLSVLMMVLMTASPLVSFAAEEDSFAATGGDFAAVTAERESGPDDAEETEDAEPAELTEVTVAGSMEELAEESEAARGNEAFFTIDASKDDSAELATEEVSDDVTDILSGGGSASEKQDEIIGALEDSGLYRAEGSGKSKVEVTSRFACQRLRLTAPQEKEINAFGATKAVYFGDSYLLSYDSMEAAMLAYDALVDEYGRDAVLIDSPMKLNDSESIKGWGSSYMRMGRQRTLTDSSGLVTVAVIDTGIQRSHPIFRGKTILEGRDYINEDDDPADDEGHGTSVCGIIAESTPSNVRILPVKAVDRYGEASLMDVLFAINYADENGADIINLSLGGYTKYKEDLEYCEKHFRGFDALIVCAAGNESKDMDAPGVMEIPGELSSTVCVGSITAGKKRSSFSNYGQAVDFAAPGSSILTADRGGSYRTMSGTSFSSPYLAAAAAIVKAEHSDYSNDQIIGELRDMSEDLGDPGRDVYFGYGCPRFPADPEHQHGGSIAEAAVWEISSRTYTGAAQTQDPGVMINGELLEQGTDYEILYENNVDAGKADMTIIGTGNYSGEIGGLSFTIHPKQIRPQISLSASSFARTGKEIRPDVTVRDGSRTLAEGTDYTVSYSGNVDAGTAYVTVSCRGNYSGSGTESFRITDQDAASGNAPKKITPKVRLSKTRYTWNNKVHTPSVAVYDGSVRLPASQYTVSYPKGRRNVGEYSVRVTLKGDYSGKKTVTYTIVPKGTRIKSLKGAEKAVRVRWARQSAKMSSAVISGYQIQVSSDPEFRKNKRTVTVRGYRNTSDRIGWLAPHRKYYVRVRTYRTVGEKRFCSAWSRAGKVRTR